jgi:hypothetical protein
LPPIPVLSKKSGWTFEASHFADQKAYYEPRLEDSRTKAVVVYLQGKDQPNLGDWLAPLNTWTKVKDLKIDGNPLLIFQKKSGK